MRKLSILFILLMSAAVGFAQQQRVCATMEHLEAMLQEDPGMAERMQQIEAFTNSVLTNNTAERAVEGVITIPVVVHVLYNVNQPQQNISDAQIQSQLDVLNEDFRRLNADASNTLAQFVGVAADFEIEFCLASQDPNGNPTTGIERRSSTRSTWGTGTTMKRYAQGGLDAWPADSYLNMWVCNIGGGILGFATFPGGAAANDGVVVSPNYFGSSDYDVSSNFYLSAPYDLGRTLTHEVGHWLNLRHIWGDGGCGVDDFVGDTPPSDASNYGCPLSHVSCGTLDMVQNYMDYTEDACMNIYTQGQKARGRALFEPGGIRAAMLNSQGCNDPVPTCYAPLNAEMTEIGDNMAWVGWSNHPYASNVTIEMLVNGTWQSVNTSSVNPARVVNLSSCTEYTIRLKANCPNLDPAQSEPTEAITFTTTGEECEPPSCDTPENLYAANITFTQATLGWDAVDGATTYKAEGRLKGGLGLFTRTKIVATNMFRTNPLFPFLTYEYRVQSICDGLGLTSPYSGWFPFTLNPITNGLVVDDTGVEVVKFFDTESLVQAYPNPSQGIVKFNYYGQDLDQVRLVVSDITGKQLKSFDFNLMQSGVEQVNLGDLERGLYLMTFQRDGVILYTEKVMIAR